MSAPGAILREIHRLRRNAKDLKGKIDQGPKQLKTQEDKVARQEQILKQAQDDLKHLKVATHEKEGSLKVTDEQVKKYTKQLSDIMSKKEYDALKSELTHSRDKAAKLEDQILEALGQIEERTAQIPVLENNLKEARAQAEQFNREYQARLADLAKQHQETLAKLAEVEGTLPADIKPQYDRLTAAKGEDALALVEGRTCTSCYTEITPQSYNDLIRALFVLCKNCGRMLYLAE
ncbi:MAG TPA: C4-type zinc ribbon domain-containing protein [Gemmataceae bacterium]|nr:C4-type zinc ribbon domain-containing protein [Gemmataceae bacterium]